jgi:hypothetical protein
LRTWPRRYTQEFTDIRGQVSPGGVSAAGLAAADLVLAGHKKIPDGDNFQDAYGDLLNAIQLSPLYRDFSDNKIGRDGIGAASMATRFWRGSPGL